MKEKAMSVWLSHKNPIQQRNRLRKSRLNNWFQDELEGDSSTHMAQTLDLLNEKILIINIVCRQYIDILC